MKKFIPIKTDNNEIKELQKRLIDFFDNIIFREILDGKYIEDKNIAGSGTTKIAHKLGRIPKGIIKVEGDSDIKYASLPDKYFLYLVTTSGSAETVSLWVF